ncbi:putative polyamine transporter [Panicum miliaceum]|uniref:Polyamine transporter n=1 Tax=Panicum miliaceum TaxID=4540 RepID=A0A3L6TI46_PANMI|nr:putative polyamine transporter [Panicum miliaceum]
MDEQVAGRWTPRIVSCVAPPPVRHTARHGMRAGAARSDRAARPSSRARVVNGRAATKPAAQSAGYHETQPRDLAWLCLWPGAAAGRAATARGVGGGSASYRGRSGRAWAGLTTIVAASNFLYGLGIAPRRVRRLRLAPRVRRPALPRPYRMPMCTVGGRGDVRRAVGVPGASHGPRSPWPASWVSYVMAFCKARDCHGVRRFSWS